MDNPARLATGAYNVLILGRYSLLHKTKQEDRAFMAGHLAFYQELAPHFGLPEKLSWEF